MTDTRKFLRQCVNCKEYKNKQDLIRITKDFIGGNIQFNNNNQINGRSVYLCKNSECIKEALKKKKIEVGMNMNFYLNIKILTNI